MSWIYLFLGIIATEALTEVLLKGKVFDTPRAWLYGKASENSFFGKLIRCPYCTSFWIAAALTASYLLVFKVWFPIVLWLAFTRGANMLNDLGDKIFFSQYRQTIYLENPRKEEEKP